MAKAKPPQEVNPRLRVGGKSQSQRSRCHPAIRHVKLTRFRGHRTICVRGVHDVQDESPTHLSFVGSWWNWCTPAARRRSWRGVRTDGAVDQELGCAI